MPADMTTLPQNLSRDDLRAVATRQKVIIICLSLYVALALLALFVPTNIATMIGAFTGVIIIVATVYVFLLATRLYGTAFGILLGILTLLPLIGIIVLLIVNARAIAVLRAAGVEVGFFGVKQPVA
jgi:hypothetical protein